MLSGRTLGRYRTKLNLVFFFFLNNFPFHSWAFIYAEEVKICDKAWRAQRVHVHGPKEGRAHSLCGIPDKTKAQTCPPRFRFLKTCAARKGLGLQGQDLSHKEKTYPTRIRLALHGKDLGYKERRQDLTTIKAPTSSSHQGTHN